MVMKLFVSDIDGTLMDSRKQIRDEDVRAIREANQMGVAICLASGRMYEEIRLVMDELEVPCYAICQNGAAIIGLDGGIIQSNDYHADLALSVREAVRHPELVTVICSADGNYVSELTPEAERVGKRFLTPLRERREVMSDIAQGMPVTKFSIYGTVPLLQSMLDQLQDQYGDRITASFSDPDGIDVMPGGVDKGTGVELLMRLLGIQGEEAVCIGDSFNDLAMFRACSRSVAMSHAPDAIRIAATHKADTVGQAIIEFLGK
ncbi:HAD family hydrolase [Paenibacillus spongiae]|uniref:HAD family hydrolase n=1 Tax=Paenibacillus spongiae TaxID=2909671 RepID=A0ABY5S957_9BACL|nr:HAD family hydrolase [Paenibacillus spongiae]UVI30457.1 HAD family hydrolase [Paenibacillus spongiae]